MENFMDMICNFREEYITHKNIDEVIKRGAREGRLRVLNQLTEDQKKGIEKKGSFDLCKKKRGFISSTKTFHFTSA
jgi:hypothetical protein